MTTNGFTGNISWMEAIKTVLADATAPMHYTEIAEAIGKAGLKKKVGATPHASVNATITSSISSEDSPFARVGRGIYALKSKLDALEISQDSAESEKPAEAGVITSIGMYWRYSEVDWKTNLSLLGRSIEGSDPINFASQIGIYLLHDRGKVIYVGRAIDGTLGKRLFDHTKDRLNGRWDRFSWFGLRRISESGSILDEIPNFGFDAVITAMEAVLIESLEPPQNRRRGDLLTAVEYLQVPRKADERAVMVKMLSKMISSNDEA